MFGRGIHIKFEEACARAKSFLDQIMKNKPIRIYNKAIGEYFQNN